MVSFPTKLAATIDEWTASSRCRLLVENERQVVISDVTAQDAEHLASLLRSEGWSFVATDELEDEVEDFQAGVEPYKLMVDKPASREGEINILTQRGFSDWLSRGPDRPIARIGNGTAAFETYGLRIAAWGDEDRFRPIDLEAGPRTVVRDHGETRRVPSSIGPWLLREESSLDWSDPIVKTWHSHAASVLVSVLAQEIEADGTLTFRGPPVRRYDNPGEQLEAPDESSFVALQDLVRWIFQEKNGLEARHGLAAAEIVRVDTGSHSPKSLIRSGIRGALEGAKTAHEMGLQELSFDALKALGDLRKSVADEAAKLTEISRQLAAATAAALFTGIAVMAARMSFAAGSDIFALVTGGIGVVLAAYVSSVIWSGWRYMTVQRRLRHSWRHRLYRYLPDEEYDDLVRKPAGSAEDAYKLTAWLSGLIAVVLVVAMIAISLIEPTIATEVDDPSSSSESKPSTSTNPDAAGQ